MKSLLEIVSRTAFALAVLACAGMLCAFAAEQSGWLGERIRRSISERLGEPVYLEAARIQWFARELELDGLRFESDTSHLWVESLTARIGRRGWHPTLEQLELRGGRVELSLGLLERLRRIAAHNADSPTGPPEPLESAAPGLATVIVRDLQIDLVHPRWGDLPIGLSDLLCTRDAAGKPRIEGRIVPDLAQGDDLAEIYLSGHEVAPGLIELSGSTTGVALTVDTLREGTALEAFRPFAPSGRLALDGSVRIWLDGRAPPSGELRAVLSDASFRPPNLETPVEDLRIDLRAAFRPGRGAELTTEEAWSGLARVEAAFLGAPIEGWALYGGQLLPERRARAWLRLRDVQVGPRTLRDLGLEGVNSLAQTFAALAPRGELADVVLAAEMTPDGGLETALEVGADGGLAVAYHGWPDKGVQQGVPLPIEGVGGTLLALRSERVEPIQRVAFYDMSGRHSGGGDPLAEAHARGLVVSAEPGKSAWFDIAYGASRVPVDDQLRTALGGLRGTDFIWPSFAPRGGQVSAFEAHMQRMRSEIGMRSHFDVELAGVAAAYAPLPLPATALAGHLELWFDAKRGSAASFALEGRTSTADRLSVTGRVQGDPAASPGASRQMREVEVRLENVALRGTDRDVVVAAVPAVGAALAEVEPSGKVDVLYRMSQTLAGGELEHSVQITPREVQVSPQRFKVLTRNARGRVLISARGNLPGADAVEGSARARVRVQPLVGEWPGGTLVAMAADFDAPGSGRMQIVSAGVDPANRGLIGAFAEAFPSARGGARADLSILNADGRVDLTGEVVLRPETEPLTVYRIFLRGNSVGTGGAGHFALSGLDGILEQRGSQLYGEDIAAVLGRTPILLESAALSVDEHGAYRLTLAPRAQQLPIDREHMGCFLDEPTVTALVDDLGWSGAVDVFEALLTISGDSGDSGRHLEFAGQVAPRGMQIDLGLPLEVDAAAVEVERLVYENGHVRAWMDVRDLDGRVADRELAGARLALTYVEPRLSILDLSGQFEQGRVRNFAGESAGPCFSIDLADPYPFELGVRLSEVDVSGVLRGIYESEFASRGVLSGELRLAGDLDRITGIRGQGKVELRESSLWSIPVVRDLFSQLGFDQTAVFEEMRAQFRLRDGVIELDPIQVKSPLLNLVGAGTLDLDGRLHHDLQVQYSLVDRLGPFTRLIYFVQNNLLSVSVRGDMARPEVVLHGALSFLQRLRGGEGRALPLPGFAPIPERF